MLSRDQELVFQKEHKNVKDRLEPVSPSDDTTEGLKEIPAFKEKKIQD